MIADPRRHFLVQRGAEVTKLTRTPEELRATLYMDEFLRPASDAAAGGGRRAAAGHGASPTRLLARRSRSDPGQRRPTYLLAGTDGRPPNLTPVTTDPRTTARSRSLP